MNKRFPTAKAGVLFAALALAVLSAVTARAPAADDGAGSAPSVPVTAFHLTNDAHYRAAFDEVWSRRPSGPVDDERRHQWLSSLAIAAVRMRWPALAEAAGREITACWPHDGIAWGNLSCSLGRQGRYADAADAAHRALYLPYHDDAQAKWLLAAWLWRLGKKDEAASLSQQIQQSHDQTTDEQIWYGCRAFFHALTDGGESSIQEAMAAIAALPHHDFWMDFFKRDVAFDQFRLKPWFIALAGTTAAGVPPDGFVASAADSADSAEAARFIRELPHDAVEPQARAVLAELFARIEGRDWGRVPELLKAGRATGRELPEFQVIEALALARNGDTTGAMDAIRHLSHDGYRLASATNDIWRLCAVVRMVAGDFVKAARVDRAKARPLCLALIIQAQVYMDYHDSDEVIREMDAAQAWDPTLAEVPNTRGIAWLEKHDYAKAERDFRKAMELRGDFGDPCLNLAEVLYKREQFAEASRCLELGIAKGSDYPFAFMQRAKLLIAAGNVDAGVAQLEALAKRAPRPPRGLEWVCWEASSLCSLQRRFAEAERLARLVIALSPETSGAWTKLSGDLAREGRFDEALAACERAILMGPSDAIDANIIKATWLWKTGRKAESKLVMDQLSASTGEQEIGLRHVCMSIFAAVTGNEELLHQELRDTLQVREGLVGEPRTWIRGEVFFDGYRDRPWFADLLAEPAGKADAPRL